LNACIFVGLFNTFERILVLKTLGELGYSLWARFEVLEPAFSLRIESKASEY
jgi:hypothetical protein